MLFALQFVERPQISSEVWGRFLSKSRTIRRAQNSSDEKFFKLFQKICTNMLKFSNVCDNIWCKS